ncbi:MAG: hypothetical protein CMJ18_10265 [Phycisphaeraceae bacterium]|nr:hypothetical protein [Phycisphaeraceae bacterium]
MMLCLVTSLVVSGAIVASDAQSPVLAVPHLAARPTIDGNLEDGEWDKAAVTCGFRKLATGGQARAEVVVSLGHDEHGLYLLGECSGEAPDKLVGEPGKRDDHVWGHSLLEIFLSPQHWPNNRYVHLGVDHTGTVADELWTGEARDHEWNADWKAACGRREQNWFVELSIPWSALDVDRPDKGFVLRANFTRNAAGVRELSTWSALEGRFHDPNRFGSLVLAGKGPVVAVRQLPGRGTGVVPLQVELRNGRGNVEVQVIVDPVSGKRKVVEQTIKGPELEVGVPIAPARSELTIVARAPDGGILWRQSATLELPDLAPRLGRIEQEMASIGDRQVLRSEKQSLQRRIEAIAHQLGQPQDEKQLGQLSGELASLERRVLDLAMQARMARVLQDWKGGTRLPGYYVTTAVSTRKIQPKCADPGSFAEPLRIAMARGEYEPAQVVVSAVGEALQQVRVRATELKGPEGAVIPQQRVVVTPIGFVNCRNRTLGATLSGEVPDVLLPNRARDVPAGRRQPFFVTVQTTAEDAPGEYRGYVWVEGEGIPAARIPLQVRVFSITLPITSHLRTQFTLDNAGIEASERDWERYTRAYHHHAQVLLEHRITPCNRRMSPRVSSSGEWDFSAVDHYVREMLPHGLNAYSPWAEPICRMNWRGPIGDDSVECAQALERHMKSRGWWEMTYIYGKDEPGRGPDSIQPEEFEKIFHDYTVLKKAVPDLKIMQTGWNPHPVLDDLVDIWCPLTAFADIERIHAAQAAGEEVWWYVCSGPIAPYANVFVDYPGVDQRILGWQTYQNRIDGFLYWGVSVWQSVKLPVAEYVKQEYANWDPWWIKTNGDGWLLYPGLNDTAIPSMRLALIRDGFEDYDLFTEIESLSMQSGPLYRIRARKLLNLSDLSPSLTQYTKDGADLIRRREALLELAEEMIVANMGSRE